MGTGVTSLDKKLVSYAEYAEREEAVIAVANICAALNGGSTLLDPLGKR